MKLFIKMLKQKLENALPSEENRSLKTFLTFKTPYAQDSKERTQLIDSVLDCIVKINVPLSLVEHPSFVKMLSAFNSRLKLP